MLSDRSGILDDGPLGHTDLVRWRLDSSDHGRHIWSYQPIDENDTLLVQYLQMRESAENEDPCIEVAQIL